MSDLIDLLLVTDKDIAAARKHYQKSERDIQEDVAILKEWLRQQPHLPDDEDEIRLERMLLKNKCRLEQTKKKLDTCYSFKVFHPEMLELYDLKSARMQTARNTLCVGIFVPLPKLTENQERIMWFKATNAGSFDALDSFMYILMMMELLITYDYSLSDIFVFDWNGYEFHYLKTVTPNALQAFCHISMQALSGRFSSFQFTNAPGYVDIFVQMLKLALSPKLFAKIRCTSNTENIYDVIPKEALPIEYGGKEKSIYKLHEEWGQELPFHADLLTKISKRISNEKLRIEKFDGGDLFGTEGTFKKINLD